VADQRTPLKFQLE